MLGHRLDALWPVDLERLRSTHHPRSEDEIRIADGVVRMHMRQEYRFDVHCPGAKRLYALLKRRSGAPNDARTKVNEIGSALGNNGGGGRRTGPDGAAGFGPKQDHPAWIG